jgi:AraC-like DNA-binding protein
VDLLADVLAVTGVHNTIAATIGASVPWGISWPAIPGAAFYAVTAGTAWLSVAEQAPIQLFPGDIVLIPSGTGHTVGSDPDPAVNRAHADLPTDTSTHLQFGAGPSHTQILGACYEYDRSVSTQLLTLLPEIVHLHAAGDSTGLGDTLRLLTRELAQRGIASEVVLNRLVDVLLIQLLRVWLSDGGAEVRGTWLAVLDDPLVLDAMTRLHEKPAAAWTIESLAAEVNVSRATLSRRFIAVAGEGPSSYLTRWRMDLAALRLRDTNDTVEAVARSVGYTSVYAFTRAFRRSRSCPPGRYRIEARSASETPRRRASRSADAGS